MSYTVVQKINNNYYLYEVTAVWDPEKKNSRQKRKYIGKCDADGNLIAAKSDSAPKVKILGKPYLMYQVAMGMGLREKLEGAYGEDGDILLMTGIHRSTRTGLPRHSVAIMSESLLPQMVGVDPNIMLRDTSGVISLMERCGDGTQALFERMDKGNAAMVYELESLMKVMPLNLNARDPEQGITSFPPMKIFLAISEQPNGAFYFSVKRAISDRLELLRSVEASIMDLGVRDITFFLNRDQINEKRMEGLANSGIKFLKYLPVESGYGAKLLAESEEDLVRSSRTVLFGDNLYGILEKDIVLGDIRCREIILRDEMSRVSQMNTFLRSLADYEARMAKTRKDAKGSDAYMDNFDLDDVSKLFVEGPDGKMVRDTDRIGTKIRSFGTTLIITNSDDPWDVLYGKYLRQDRFKNETDTFRNELQDGSKIMHSLNSAIKTFLNEFLAIAIRTRLSEMLGLNPANYVDALKAVSNIFAVNYDGKWHVSEITPEQRAVFDKLGIPVPTDEFVEECVESYAKKHSI